MFLLPISRSPVIARLPSNFKKVKSSAARAEASAAIELETAPDRLVIRVSNAPDNAVSCASTYDLTAPERLLIRVSNAPESAVSCAST